MSPPRADVSHQSGGVFDDESLPHAITTSDDIALTLKPSTARKSTLALADVPEDDELHAIKRTSNETFRPVTADPALRHATSFPSNGCSPPRKRFSASRLSGVMPLGTSCFQESDNLIETTDHTGMTPQFRMSSSMLTSTAGIDACWEDDIDYCYQHEAEADCDFDWDRVSMENALTTGGSPNEKPSDAHRESGESLSQTYENLEAPDQDQCVEDTSAATKANSHHLPRLQTSLPELDFSATSSAKSSMASLRGPLTPLPALPSPKKIRPILQSSKSTDTLNLASLLAPHDCDLAWTQDDSFPKAPSWDHAMNFNYPFNNLSLPGTSARTSLRSGRPRLSTHHSSDNVMSSKSSSIAHSHRNTSSSGSFPELICCRNDRQQAIIVAEQLANRIAALQVPHAHDIVASSEPHPSTGNVTRPYSILKKTPSGSNSNLLDGQQLADPTMHPGSQDPSLSVATFASKLRSNSMTSSASGSSSMRASKASYSLFPSTSSTRS